MRIQNTTDYADSFLRRMASWICKEIELPVRQVKVVQVSRYSKGRRGTAYPWRGKVRLMIGDASKFPKPGFNYRGAMTPDLADRMEGLVEIAAHELLHLLIYHDSGRRRSGREAWIVVQSCRVLDLFRANREALLAEWSVAPVKELITILSVAEKREAKVLSDLERWTRKLKLAKTKVSKLTAKVRYYERKAALKGQTS